MALKTSGKHVVLGKNNQVSRNVRFFIRFVQVLCRCDLFQIAVLKFTPLINTSKHDVTIQKTTTPKELEEFSRAQDGADESQVYAQP